MIAAEPIEEDTNSWSAFVARDRIALTAGSIICLLLTRWIVQTLDVTSAPARAGALLQQPSWPVALGVAAIIVGMGTLLATIISCRAHYDAGLFCACIGLAGLSAHMGPSRFALFAGGQRVYFIFAAELIVLYAFCIIAWFVLNKLFRAGLLLREIFLNHSEPNEPLDQKLLAMAAQIMITTILLMLLCQTDLKAQTLASVGIASFIGALGAHHLVETGPGILFWIGPLVVGLLGYVTQSMGASDSAFVQSQGWFAALARPTPLDYASLGIAGAMLGYWTSQRWHQERDELDAAN